MVFVPRTMSTQHPDNATLPFFSSNSVLEGEDEVQEAFYAFSILGCQEQMWDFEGKEGDGFVVKKLLTKFENFFRHKRIGKDVRLTLRVPNPLVEKAEAKILLETLESIPRSFDAAQLFYGSDIAPIFEVILPMTSSAQGLNQIFYYYRDFVAGKQSKELLPVKVKISEWIGHFSPETINVIPLIETQEQLLGAHKIVGEYLEGKNFSNQRVFLARSDPALNYGLAGAVLLDLIALQNLHVLEEKSSVEIFPIIGVGSAPFRGNLKPTNPKNCMETFPSAQTFTIQSAFKFDYNNIQITEAIDEINSGKKGKPAFVDEKKCLEIIEKTSTEYIRQIKLLAPLINKIAVNVPHRRKRKLHIGLFGYSRQMEGISLPRAINFCCALYSIGLPPEMLGLNALSQKEFDFLLSVYQNLEQDIRDAMVFFNPESLKIIPHEVAEKIGSKLFSVAENAEHKRVTDEIISSLRKNETHNMSEKIVHAAWVRKFLG
ncbi:MAG: phosphoenolpyruvate carboxylase [archaeon]